jgi:hypothetical protein
LAWFPSRPSLACSNLIDLAPTCTHRARTLCLPSLSRLKVLSLKLEKLPDLSPFLALPRLETLKLEFKDSRGIDVVDVSVCPASSLYRFKMVVQRLFMSLPTSSRCESRAYCGWRSKEQIQHLELILDDPEFDACSPFPNLKSLVIENQILWPWYIDRLLYTTSPPTAPW